MSEIDLSDKIKSLWGKEWNAPELAYEFGENGHRKFYLRTGDAGIYAGSKPAAPTPTPFYAQSVQFDGSNDYMTRGAGLTGAADSKKGIISCWVKFDVNGNFDTLMSFANTVGGVPGGTDAGPYCNRVTTKEFFFGAQHSDGSQLLRVRSSLINASATWLHFLCSWDLAGADSSKIHLYVNDASDKTIVLGPVDNNVDYTKADWSIGGQPNGTIKFTGSLADYYFAPGQYLDFSILGNRRLFIGGDGKPCPLGTAGEIPIGTAPLIYFHLDKNEAPANFAINRGTGGNFTIAGALTAGSTSPSD